MKTHETDFDKALAGVPNYILDCPIYAHWVTYKGEVYFAMLNYKQSVTAKRAMIDLGYCATALMINGRVEKTVQYDKNKFTLIDSTVKK